MLSQISMLMMCGSNWGGSGVTSVSVPSIFGCSVARVARAATDTCVDEAAAAGAGRLTRCRRRGSGRRGRAGGEQCQPGSSKAFLA
jgi:hypothetical protein